MGETRRYLLVIKRGNHDYLPLEWNLTSFYNGENLYTLEGIDSFTRKMTRVDLVNDVLNKNMVQPEERYRGFAIIFYENGKNREVKEGTMFLEDIHIFDDEEFINFILEHINDKKFLSLIYNMCDIKSDDSKLGEFKFALKNIDLFKLKGLHGVLAALSLFKEIGYETRRKILFRVSTNASLKENKVQDDYLLKKNSDDLNG